MRKRAVAAVLAALMGSFVLASAVDAHKIKKKRVKAASNEIALDLCDEMYQQGDGCEYYGVESCGYLSKGHRGKHRVGCLSFVGGTNAEGQWECDWVELWRVKKRRNRVFNDPRGFKDTLECYDPTLSRRGSDTGRDEAKPDLERSVRILR